MAKQTWRGGNMLYPLPVVMVSCANAAGESDIITVAWAGTVCTNPPMLSVSIRPERNSYHIIRESGEFVVNLVGRRLARACDWCGVRSGRDHDKWEACKLTKGRASKLELAPTIAEAPVSIECRVSQVLELGSHHLFLAEVLAVQVEDALLDDAGKLDLGRAGLIAYSHGEYRDLGRCLGTFGYSVRKDDGARPEKGRGRRGKGGSGARGGARQPHGHTPGKRAGEAASGNSHGDERPTDHEGRAKTRRPRRRR